MLEIKKLERMLPMSKKGIVRDFSPAWFAAVMGTGGLANVTYMWGKFWNPAHALGIGLAWFNAFLFLVLLIPWIARWFTRSESLKNDLRHPSMSNFFVTMPVAVMIIATNVDLMGMHFFGKPSAFSITFFAWIVGIAGAIVFGVYSGYNMMRSDETPHQMINFSWLISPVASIAIPLVGNPLVSMIGTSNPAFAKTVLLINLSFWGIGFFLFLFIGGIVFTRLAQHSMPPAMMNPTFWITLGPIGVGAITLMGMADSAKMLGLLSSTGTLYIGSAILWGFGIWSLGIALVISRHHIKKEGKIPFSLSWWAFIFPLDAYVMSSFKMGAYFGSGLVLWYAACLTGLLAVLWITTFVRTLAGSLSGKIFQPPVPQKR